VTFDMAVRMVKDPGGSGQVAFVRGSPGAKPTLELGFHAGHLPIVTLKRAA
jgi:hypothetical protein